MVCFTLLLRSVLTLMAIPTRQNTVFNPAATDISNIVSSKSPTILPSSKNLFDQVRSTSFTILVCFMTSTLDPASLEAMEFPFAMSQPPGSLAQSDAFRTLPREYYTPKNRQDVVKDDLKRLEDSRLDLCADRGTNWESCFMYGVGGIDQSTMQNNDGDDDGDVSNSKLPEQQQQQQQQQHPERRRPPTW